MRKFVIAQNTGIRIDPENGITAPFTIGEVEPTVTFNYVPTMEMTEEEFADWTEVQRRWNEYQERFKLALRSHYDERGFFRKPTS
jgi:hypothetical protein